MGPLPSHRQGNDRAGKGTPLCVWMATERGQRKRGRGRERSIQWDGKQGACTYAEDYPSAHVQQDTGIPALLPIQLMLSGTPFPTAYRSLVRNSTGKVSGESVLPNIYTMLYSLSFL